MFRLLLRSWVCFPVREDQSRILASIISLRRSEQKIPALFEVIFVGVDDIRLDKEAGGLTEGNQMLPQQGDDVLIDERIL